MTGRPPDTASSIDTATGVNSDAPERAPAVAMDVWSRSGSKYRIRAVVLLAANVLLFSGVGMFAFWIRSGVPFAPTMEGYQDQLGLTFRFLGGTGVSLGSLLLEPISVQDVPMQIPILGLLMAALIAIPILVAILYRFWASLPFIAIVGFLAVMPWLAITLLGSCVIASVRPFRTSFRFMSALLGLLPAVVYLFLASAGTAEAVMGRIDPVDNIKFIAPWVLAIVAATVLFAIVLTIAKLVDYRPGAIAPLLAVMFGLPVALFEFRVGRDEVHYRLLEALNEAHFEEVDASEELRRAAQRAWDRHPLPRPKWQEVYELEEEKWQMALMFDLDPFRSELARHQAELVHRCDLFQRNFPASRYIPDALYIKARSLDMRVDAREFRRTKWIRFYDEVPSRASRMTWRILVENRPDSAISAVALLQLARLEARDGDVDRALDRLSMLLEEFGGRTEYSLASAHIGGTDTERPAAPPSGKKGKVQLGKVVLEAYRLRDLCASNRDPLYGYDPLCGSKWRKDSLWFGLLDLDPRHEQYVANLRALEAHYPHCQIEDNIELEIAKAEVSTTRKIQSLEACLLRFPERDAAPEALFRLGVAYLADSQVEASAIAFARLQRDYLESVWSQQASRYTQTAAPVRLTRISP